jgi:hypothetical protein
MGMMRVRSSMKVKSSEREPGPDGSVVVVIRIFDLWQLPFLTSRGGSIRRWR